MSHQQQSLAVSGPASHDGELLAICQDAVRKLLSVGQAPSLTLQLHESERSEDQLCQHFLWSPDKLFLAAWGRRIVKVHESMTGRLLWASQKLASPIRWLAWSPHGCSIFLLLSREMRIIHFDSPPSA